ncbi:MAG TPA: adenosylcobinamide-GDP ribazoletransferase [Nocardioidaceae bacterium]|nr:adenosylcobinamide-GDP ribazoletransferase [Nocardioidaceae bacterium]
MSTPRRPLLAEAWRLAVGTLSVLPVRPPTRVDRQVAGRAMLLAPAVGLLVALPACAALWLLGLPGRPGPGTIAAPLAIGLVAVLTRGMHLDGLADTVDGLGSRRPAPQALEVMRRGDVGPFGVVALVLVILVQVAAVVQLGPGRAPIALLVALVAGRAALPGACRRGVGAARPDGLGATVAGTVRPVAALASTVVSFALVAAIAVLAGSDVRDTTPMLVAGVAGIAVALAAVTHAVRRLGGITGDVLGFGVELATTATLALAAVLVG